MKRTTKKSASKKTVKRKVTKKVARKKVARRNPEIEIDDVLYTTQGGGIAYWDELQQAYYFKVPPKNAPYLKNQEVPSEWGIQPVKVKVIVD